MLFLLPGAVFFAAIFLYPSLRTIQMSLSDVNANNITQGNWPFVGLKNFVAVFHLQATGTTLGNTVIFLVGSIVPQVVIGLLLAVGLRTSSRLRRIGRALVLLPPHWQTAGVLLGCWSAGLSVAALVDDWFSTMPSGALVPAARIACSAKPCDSSK